MATLGTSIKNSKYIIGGVVFTYLVALYVLPVWLIIIIESVVNLTIAVSVVVAPFVAAYWIVKKQWIGIVGWNAEMELKRHEILLKEAETKERQAKALGLVADAEVRHKTSHLLPIKSNQLVLDTRTGKTYAVQAAQDHVMGESGKPQPIVMDKKMSMLEMKEAAKTCPSIQSAFEIAFESKTDLTSIGVFGASGGGKSVGVSALLKLLKKKFPKSKITFLTPKSVAEMCFSAWMNVRVAGCGHKYGEIRAELEGVLDIIKERSTINDRGRLKALTPVFVAIDEISVLNREFKEHYGIDFVNFWNKISIEGRSLRVYVIIINQSDRANELGLNGKYDQLKSMMLFYFEKNKFFKFRYAIFVSPGAHGMFFGPLTVKEALDWQIDVTQDPPECTDEMGFEWIGRGWFDGEIIDPAHPAHPHTNMKYGGANGGRAGRAGCAGVRGAMPEWPKRTEIPVSFDADEKTVVEMKCAGKSNRDIFSAMGWSPGGWANKKLNGIFDKFGIRTGV